MPDLESVTDEESEGYPDIEMADDDDDPEGFAENEDLVARRIQSVLTQCQPFPGDGQAADLLHLPGTQHFIVDSQPRNLYCIYDRVQGFETHIHAMVLHWRFFSIGRWFAERCAENSEIDQPWDCAH